MPRAILSRTTIFLAALAPTLTSTLTPAAALQPDDPAPSASPSSPDDLSPPRDTSLTLTLGGLSQPDADLDDDASFSVSRLLAGATLAIPLDGPLLVSISANTEHSWYDFSDASVLFDGSADTPELLHTSSLSLFLTRPPTAQWGWFAGVNIESSGEYDADFSDTLTYGGLAGVLYAPSRDLTLGLGVLVRTRLEDDALVIPIPTIDWRIDENWRLGTTPMFAAQGIGATLRYQATDTLAFGLAAGFARREYRLDSDIPDGILLDSSLPLLIGVEYTPTPSITLQAYAGASLWGEIETQNSSGDRIDRSDADTVPLVGGSVSFRF